MKSAISYKKPILKIKVKPEFVVEQHKNSPLHFNFKLLIGKAFKSWAIPQGPSMNVEDKRLAIEIEELFALAPDMFTVWDKGTYTGEKIESQFKKGTISFTLFGSKLRGTFSLFRTKANQWLFLKKDPKKK